MNIARAHRSSPDLWDRYARLPAGPKMVLRLKSLVFLPTGKTVFLECLTRAGLRASAGKGGASRSLNTVLDALVRQGLLTQDLACPPELLHPVAVDAVQAKGEQLVSAVRKAFPARRSSSYYSYGQQLDADALCRLIRLAIYANDEAGFIADRELHDKELAPHRASHLLALLFAGVPLATEWLAGRGVAIQLALFEAKLSAFLETGVPGPDLPALIAHYRAQQDREGFGPVRRVLPQYDLLSGRLQDVRGGIGKGEDATGVTQQALAATVAFLEGR